MEAKKRGPPQKESAKTLEDWRDWKRAETRAGVPYYINDYTEKTQWDHPQFVEIINSLGQLNSVKYAAYRTALKLKALQQRLKYDLVELDTICSVFEFHRLAGTTDTVIDVDQLYHILHDVYQRSLTSNRNLCTELLLNYILNLFDRDRTGCIAVKPVKLSLAVICSAKITEKYKFIYRQTCDHTGQVSRNSLKNALLHLCKIPELLLEAGSFSSENVTAAVNTCFNQSVGSLVTGEVLLDWLLAEPETLLWLPTFHRLSAALTVKHESKCNTCKAYPIVGLRFKCLRCFNYDMCQNCFFANRSSKKHKYTHPIQEYCVPTSSKDDLKAFGKLLRNSISKKHRKKFRQSYLSVGNASTTPGAGENQSEMTAVAESELHHSDIHADLKHLCRRVESMEAMDDLRKGQKKIGREPGTASSPSHTVPRKDSNKMHQLNYLVNQLELENKDLLKQLETESRQHRVAGAGVGSGFSGGKQEEGEESELGQLRQHSQQMAAKQEILEEHNKQLEMQLQRLRMLLKRDESEQTALSTGKRFNGRGLPTAATPLSRSAATPPFTLGGRDMIDSSRLLPPHLANQTAVQFPNVTVSRPSEEEIRLRELLGRLEAIHPLNTTSSFPDQVYPQADESSGEGNEILEAAQKLGQAFAHLVSHTTTTNH